MFSVSCVETNVFSEWPTGTWENDLLHLDFDRNIGNFINNDTKKLHIVRDHGAYCIYIYYRENDDEVTFFRGEYRINKEKDTLCFFSNDKVIYKFYKLN